MIKKHITPVNIAVYLGLLTHLAISEVYGNEYARYFMYFLITIIIPNVIFNLIKERREDKLNSTTLFQASIYKMLIMAVVLVIFFFITKQNYR
jgi:uncharacterized membrane protein